MELLHVAGFFLGAALALCLAMVLVGSLRRWRVFFEMVGLFGGGLVLIIVAKRHEMGIESMLLLGLMSAGCFLVIGVGAWYWLSNNKH